MGKIHLRRIEPLQKKASRSQYVNDWKRTHKDLIRVEVDKGMKELWRQHANHQGLSLTQYIIKVVQKDILDSALE